MTNASQFKIALVTGGCKSGKSNQALALAESLPTAPDRQPCFIATCIPADDELQLRVKSHQQTRGSQWRTVEAPYDLPGAIEAHADQAAVLVVDCLTMWLSNLLCAPDEQDLAGDLPDSFQRLSKALQQASCPVILVSNEVGCGIVPENALARQFRDLAGNLNQLVARQADLVVWCVSGIPVPIK